MIKKITLTEEHLKLIPFILINEDYTDNVNINKKNMFLLGTHLLDDMATILGHRDKAIKGTSDDADGSAYPDDVENHLLELHSYLVDNLYYIETLIHQFVVKGGLTAGTYKCKDNELIWWKEE